ncbi:O-antigen polysaccharide polymerase Wzy [Maribellus comscasis]|uniref:O-antigen polysaccharide polymerase Wzy n=1 Tax=Maribellus comscasis TaxID=2681766 RepID=A0A6I6JZI7_9BACT|nr:O-antigen polysaccharide polymerase Wzy [Maribellus comscasis]QGY46570.1 O-antigen polysaccharide polymerase Wzy [Maribellus comscasis]
MKSLIQLFFFIISLILFFGAPDKYNYPFNSIVTIVFLLQSIPFIINRSKKNYVNFYTLFFTSFFFVNFFYPTVLYPIDPKFFTVFSLPFDSTYINKGTALSQLLTSSFILGASSIKNVNNRLEHNNLNKFLLSHYSVTRFTIFLFFLFVATVGREFLAGNFKEHSSLSVYILQLLTCSFILSSILFFRNLDLLKSKRMYIITVGIYVILFLSIGDRGPALNLLLLIVGLYSIHVKTISAKYLIILGISGLTLMHLVGLGRTSNVDEINGNIISRGIERTQNESQFQSIYSLTQSFVVNNRNLYVGMEYVDKNGINWGSTSILTATISVVPFAQSAIEKLTGYELQTSSDFLTTLTFGKQRSYGLGSNLVVDVYLSFGSVGAVLLFLLFGRFIESIRKKVLQDTTNIYFSIIYFTLLSYSIYYPRTGLFMPMKYIIWTLIIYYMFRQFEKQKIKHVRH